MYNPILKRGDRQRYNNGDLHLFYYYSMNSKEEVVNYYKTYESFDDVKFFYRDSTLAELLYIKDPDIHGAIDKRLSVQISSAFGDYEEIDLSWKVKDDRPNPGNIIGAAKQYLWSIHQLQRSSSFFAAISVHTRSFEHVLINPGMSRAMFAECRPDEVIPSVLCEYNQYQHPRAHELDWHPINTLQLNSYEQIRGESHLYGMPMETDACNVYYGFTDTISETVVNRQFHHRPGKTTQDPLHTNGITPDWPSVATRTPDEVRVNDIPLFVRGSDGMWGVVPYRKAFDYEL